MLMLVPGLSVRRVFTPIPLIEFKSQIIGKFNMWNNLSSCVKIRFVVQFLFWSEVRKFLLFYESISSSLNWGIRFSTIWKFSSYVLSLYVPGKWEGSHFLLMYRHWSGTSYLISENVFEILNKVRFKIWVQQPFRILPIKRVPDSWFEVLSFKISSLKWGRSGFYIEGNKGTYPGKTLSVTSREL